MIANLPDGRVVALNRDSGEIVWDKQVAAAERVRHARSSSTPRRSPPKARCWSRTAPATRGTRGWLAALDARDRQRAVALVRGAEAGRSRQRDLEGQDQCLEDRRRRHVADRLLRPGHEAHDLGHRQSGSAYTIRRRGRATISTPTRRSRSTSIPASSPGTSSTRRTIRGTTTRTASTCSTTPRSTARTARSSAISGATASSTRSTAPTAASSRAANT